MAKLKAVSKTQPDKGKKTSMTKKEIGACAAEYNELSVQIKVLTERKNLLAAKLKVGAVTYGTIDDKGSYYFETNGFSVGSVSCVSMSLDQDKGVKFLEKKGLGDCIDVVKQINESQLEKAVSENRLTLDEVEGFTNRKHTFKVSVKSIKDMPEVETSSLALAASKK